MDVEWATQKETMLAQVETVKEECSQLQGDIKTAK